MNVLARGSNQVEVEEQWQKAVNFTYDFLATCKHILHLVDSFLTILSQKNKLHKQLKCFNFIQIIMSKLYTS